jgi:two-component system cell cycle response regulator DivK
MPAALTALVDKSRPSGDDFASKRAAHPPQRLSTRKHAQGKSAMNTILIVEDSASNVKLAQAILSGAGYKVVVAANAEAALPLLNTYQPGVVLMDINLPGMDGLTALQHLRTDPQTRATKVIAITAMTMKGDRERILAAGFDGYVAKPFTVEQLLAAVQAAFAS